MNSTDRYCSTCGAGNPSTSASCFACGRSLKITVPLPQDVSNAPLLQQRYRILSQLGTGGSSAVYKAEDTLLNDRLVAIKAISLRGLKAQEMIDLTGAFNREVLLLSGLKHPSVPHIYQSFSDREAWYVVMDFIEGTTLEKYLESIAGERLQVGEVLDIALQISIVLDYLHTGQPPVIFRDLKPANIMLKPDGRIALIDFGIARHFKPGKTRDTTPLGTPGYAAPEQYGRAQTTPRTDIYSFGVILHQLLTGDDMILHWHRLTLRHFSSRINSRLPDSRRWLCRWWNWRQTKGPKVSLSSKRSCSASLENGPLNTGKA